MRAEEKGFASAISVPGFLKKTKESDKVGL
jgi:hypothetical protein